MKTFIVFLLLTGCKLYPNAPTPVSTEMKFNKGDVVVFNYTNDNIFYSKACENRGVMEDFIRYWSGGNKHYEYLIEVNCCSGSTDLVWIHEEDIIGLSK